MNARQGATFRRRVEALDQRIIALANRRAIICADGRRAGMWIEAGQGWANPGPLSDNAVAAIMRAVQRATAGR